MSTAKTSTSTSPEAKNVAISTSALRKAQLFMAKLKAERQAKLTPK